MSSLFLIRQVASQALTTSAGSSKGVDWRSPKASTKAMQSDDEFFCMRIRAPQVSVDPSVHQSKHARVKSTTRHQKRSSSTPDDVPRPMKKQRQSSDIAEEFSLDYMAAEARRKKASASKAVDGKDASSSRQALSSLVSLSQVTCDMVEDDDWGVDESHTHDALEKRKKQSALEALRQKRQGKVPQPVSTRPSVEEPAPGPSKTKSSFRPAPHSAPGESLAASKRSNRAPSVKDAIAKPVKAVGETMESVADRVAASISRRNDRGHLESLSYMKRQAEASRSWALPLKVVSGPITRQIPGPVDQPKASTSKVVIDLDDSDGHEEDVEEGSDNGDDQEMEDGTAECEDAIDAAFGMDKLSPRSRRKFLAIAGLLDEGEMGKGDKLNEGWDQVLEQEKVPKKTAKRGKTWNSYRGRGGKPWFRKKRGGGRGRGRGRR